MSYNNREAYLLVMCAFGAPHTGEIWLGGATCSAPVPARLPLWMAR